MYKKYYTYEEVTTMKVSELPNVIYNAIMAEFKRVMGFLSDRMIQTISKQTVMYLDQHINLYKFITVIG